MTSQAYKSKVQSDKSISHRALMLAALSDGPVVIENCSPAEDVGNTMKIIEQLGVSVERRQESLLVTGAGLNGLQAPEGVLDTGNSGTGIRLLSGLLAGQKFSSTITGDAQVQSRPMKRVIEPLRLMGAEITGTKDTETAPLQINGVKSAPGLKAINYRMPVKSAQVKSAILLAGLYAEGQLAIQELAVTRDHTERMLEHFGCRLEREGMTLRLIDRPALRADKVRVPGDLSAAAFCIAAAILADDCSLELPQVGLNPTRTGFLDILKRMGAELKIEIEETRDNEPVGTITASSSKLHGIKLTQAEIDSAIDELPLLGVVAARAQGETVVEGAEELRVKESDRIKSTVGLVEAIGGKAVETKTGYTVTGSEKLRAKGVVKTHGDHRIAMSAFAVGVPGIEVDNRQCIATSDPGFLDWLESFRKEFASHE